MYNHVYVMSKKGFDYYMRTPNRDFTPMPYADLAFYIDEKNVAHIIKNKQSFDDAVSYIEELGCITIIAE